MVMDAFEMQVISYRCLFIKKKKKVGGGWGAELFQNKIWTFSISHVWVFTEVYCSWMLRCSSLIAYELSWLSYCLSLLHCFSVRAW